MFKARKVLIIFLFCVAPVMRGCTELSPSASSDSTVQTEGNRALQTFALIVQDLADEFQGVDDCESFNLVFGALNKTLPCAQSGSKTFSVIASDCDPGPPFSEAGTLEIIFQPCQEEGFNGIGSLFLNFSTEEESFEALLSANGLVINGLPYSFSDLSIVVEPEGTTCSGAMTVQGMFCAVAADCNFCPF